MLFINHIFHVLMLSFYIIEQGYAFHEQKVALKREAESLLLNLLYLLI